MYLISSKEFKSQSLNLAKKSDNSSLLEPTNLNKDLFNKTEIKSQEICFISKIKDEINTELYKKNWFLKIDVQGLEINVLKGANDLLEKFKYIYIELSFKEFYKSQILGWEIINFLENKKFKLIRSENCIYDKLELIQGDFLFKRT